MKRIAATAITLMMTAAIGTAAASPFDHNDNRRTASYASNGGAGNANARHDYRNDRDNDDRRWSEGRRWNDRNHDGRWDRYSYRPLGYGRGYYGYYGYGGYRSYYPSVVSVAYVGGPAPYYPAPYAYGNGAYAYDNGPYAYGNGYVACDPRVRYDNNGGKLIGAVLGGVLGNTVGKGDGRTAATVAGAAIGYGIGASVDNDRRYDDCRSY